MKKAKNAFFFFSLLTLFLLSCTSQESAQPLASGSTCPKTNYSGQKAEGMISLAQAMEITQLFYDDYAKSHVNMDGKPTPREDTRNIWYSLETLKRYIWAMEDTLCKQGCNLDSMGLGLHFYFAKYPDAKKTMAMGVDSAYAHQQTLVISATYKDGGVNVDFDPYHVGSQPCKPTPLKSRVPGSLSNGAGGQEEGALNHGGMIPPPYGAGSFPTGN